jgi:hypothetical protein
LHKPAEILDRVCVLRSGNPSRKGHRLSGFGSSLGELLSIVAQMAFRTMPIAQQDIALRIRRLFSWPGDGRRCKIERRGDQ